VISRYLCYAAASLILSSIVCIAIPGYVSKFPIESIIPFCATRFNSAIVAMLRNTFGIFFSSLFSWKLFPVIISVTPALVRGSTLLSINEHMKRDEEKMKSLRALIVVSGILTIPISALPLLVYFQLTGSVVSSLLIVIFWFVPLAFLCAAYMFFGWFAKSSPYKVYIVWLLLYLTSLFAVILFGMFEFGVLRWLLNALQDPDIYFEVIAEVGLANVLIGDILFASLF
jgi:hypothetical protein